MIEYLIYNSILDEFLHRRGKHENGSDHIISHKWGAEPGSMLEVIEVDESRGEMGLCIEVLGIEAAMEVWKDFMGAEDRIRIDHNVMIVPIVSGEPDFGSAFNFCEIAEAYSFKPSWTVWGDK